MCLSVIQLLVNKGENDTTLNFEFRYTANHQHLWGHGGKHIPDVFLLRMTQSVPFTSASCVLLPRLCSYHRVLNWLSSSHGPLRPGLSLDQTMLRKCSQDSGSLNNIQMQGLKSVCPKRIVVPLLWFFMCLEKYLCHQKSNYPPALQLQHATFWIHILITWDSLEYHWMCDGFSLSVFLGPHNKHSKTLLNILKCFPFVCYIPLCVITLHNSTHCRLKTHQFRLHCRVLCFF